MQDSRLEDAVACFFSRKAAREFREKLQLNNSGLQKFFSQGILLGFAASIGTIALLFHLKEHFLYITVFSSAAFFAPMLILFFIHDYLFERNRRKKEEAVPDFLLQASAFPRGTPFTVIVEHSIGKGFGLLGKEFKRAGQEMERGASVEQALLNMGRRNKSSVIDRTVNLLIQGYKSGADMCDIFRESAADLLETNALLQERNAALVVEKYTLLFAGGLIVPAVLGLIAGLVTGFNLASLELLDFGISVKERQAVLEALLLANKIYIAEYALLAATFLGMQEADSKKAVLYAALLLPLSLFTYFAASALPL